jgi:hypothetical protein
LCVVLAWLVRVPMIVLVPQQVGSVAIDCWRTRRRAVAGKGRLRDGDSGRHFCGRVW